MTECIFNIDVLIIYSVSDLRNVYPFSHKMVGLVCFVMEYIILNATVHIWVITSRVCDIYMMRCDTKTILASSVISFH